MLLDRSGVIRYVHPGMEYHDAGPGTNHDHCQRDMTRIREAIEKVLGNSPAGATSGVTANIRGANSK